MAKNRSIDPEDSTRGLLRPDHRHGHRSDRDDEGKRHRHERRAVGPADPELLGCLMAHDWPGNVRELRNLVESVFIDPPDGPIGLAHLPPVFQEMFARYRSAPASERDRLLLALEHTNWNKAEAAKSLKWSRMTLYRRLAKYRLHRSA